MSQCAFRLLSTAGLATVVALSAATPTWAQSSPAAGDLTADEKRNREAYQKQLDGLPTVAQLSRSPLFAGVMDALLPGLGTYYSTGNGNKAFSTAYTVFGLDLVAAYLTSTFVKPASFTNPQFATILGATLGTNHVLFGGLGGALQAHETNKALPDQVAEVQKRLRDAIAKIDASARKRGEAYAEGRERVLSAGRSHFADGKLEWAISDLSEAAYAQEPDVKALRQEVEAALATKKSEYAAKKAQDDAFRLKKGRELLDKLIASAAKYAGERDYEHAIALLAEVPSEVPGEWRMQVNDLVNKYVAAEERAGGREKLRREREARLARQQQQRAEGIERALYQQVLAGNRQGVLKKLAEYDTAGEAGSVRGRAMLFAAAATKLKNGSIRPGEALVMQCQVETVTNGGMVVIVKNSVGGILNYIARGYGMQTDESPLRVFVRTRGLAGVVDGDGMTLGVRSSGTFSYNTVAGSRATIRAVDLTVRLD